MSLTIITPELITQLKNDIIKIHDILNNYGTVTTENGEVLTIPELIQVLREEFDTKIEITDPGHNIAFEDWIRGDYSKGNALTPNLSDVIGIVIEVVSPDMYRIQRAGFCGEIMMLPGNPGDTMFLQDDGKIGLEPGTVYKEIGVHVPGGLWIDIKMGIIGGEVQDITVYEAHIYINGYIPEATQYSIIAGGINYLSTGQGNLREDAASFLESKSIQAYLNGAILTKNEHWMWVSPSSFILMVATDPGDYIYIRS